MSMITDRNLAIEYAKLFELGEQAANETGAQYRERIARALFDKGERIRAHEVLWNERMSADPFSRGSLDRGYGDKFITEIAGRIEACFQEAQSPRNPGLNFPLSVVIAIIILLLLLFGANLITLP